MQKTFEQPENDDEILFYLPIRRSWIRQFILALILICHSSYRNVIEILDNLFDYQGVSLGTINNIVNDAVIKAFAINQKEDLTHILHITQDEIFQSGKPVLTGIDLDSGYCFLSFSRRSAG